MNTNLSCNLWNRLPQQKLRGSVGIIRDTTMRMFLYRSMDAFAGVFDRDCRLRHPCLKAGRNLGALYFTYPFAFIPPILMKLQQLKRERCLFGFHLPLIIPLI